MNPEDIYAEHVGVDESGRGCVGGSMFVVGVKLKQGVKPSSIRFANDSKKTSRNKRIFMAKEIRKLVDFKICKNSAYDIDKFGLSYCLKRSLEEIKEHFFSCPLLFDGNCSYGVTGVETMVKADDKIHLVSAASIIAKVLKDQESLDIDKEFPEYGFKDHCGYVNEIHTNAIIKYGYTHYHRKTYNIKAFKGLNIKIRD